MRCTAMQGDLSLRGNLKNVDLGDNLMNNKKNTVSGSRAVSRHRMVAAGLAACLVFSFGSIDPFANFLISSASAEPAPIDGGQLYNTYCTICHKTGLNAAPKYGSKPLWAKRIAQGRDTVYANSIIGLRGMPPRGGFAHLTDEEVIAATDYMVRGSGGWAD